MNNTPGHCNDSTEVSLRGTLSDPRSSRGKGTKQSAISHQLSVISHQEKHYS